MTRCLAVLALTAGLLASGVVVATEPSPTQSEIEEALTCQCGCGLTVHSCNHLQCPSGEPMKEEIGRRLAAGESRATILAAFAAKYGEKVLSAPTSWFAWVTPFAALLVAATVVVVVVRSRVRTSAALATSGSPAPPGDPAVRARLERELSELDRDA